MYGSALSYSRLVPMKYTSRSGAAMPRLASRTVMRPSSAKTNVRPGGLPSLPKTGWWVWRVQVLVWAPGSADTERPSHGQVRDGSPYAKRRGKVQRCLRRGGQGAPLPASRGRGAGGALTAAIAEAPGLASKGMSLAHASNETARHGRALRRPTVYGWPRRAAPMERRRENPAAGRARAAPQDGPLYDTGRRRLPVCGHVLPDQVRAVADGIAPQMWGPGRPCRRLRRAGRIPFRGGQKGALAPGRAPPAARCREAHAKRAQPQQRALGTERYPKPPIRKRAAAGRQIL